MGSPTSAAEACAILEDAVEHMAIPPEATALQKQVCTEASASTRLDAWRAQHVSKLHHEFPLLVLSINNSCQLSDTWRCNLAAVHAVLGLHAVGT